MFSPLNLNIPNTEMVCDVEFSENGLYMAVLFYNGEIKLYILQGNTFTEIAKTQPIGNNVSNISLLSTDKGCAVILGDDYGKIHLLQLSNKQMHLITSFTHHDSAINSLKFAPVGKSFAAASNDGYVSYTYLSKDIWVPSKIKVSEYPVTCLSWSSVKMMTFIDSPNAENTHILAASTMDGNIVLLDLMENNQLQIRETLQVSKSQINYIAIRPFYGIDRYEIAVAASDGCVNIWYFEHNKWTCIEVLKSNDVPSSVKFSSNGFLLGVGFVNDVVNVYRERDFGKWVLIG